jgi:uracil-DNA glycosylase
MTSSTDEKLTQLLAGIRQCTLCSKNIPAPRPIVQASASASILIIGQAPGAKAHASGKPFDDASGARLRQWMGIDTADFYDEALVSIIPMGFCYPGKGKSGDLPPRAECAPTWHTQLLPLLVSAKCTLLVGAYAQNRYGDSAHSTLTARVKDWRRCGPKTFMLPHPSPRNVAWFKRNPWFDHEVVPALRHQVAKALNKPATSLPYF